MKDLTTIQSADEDALFNYLLPCAPNEVETSHLEFLNSVLKEVIVQYKTIGRGVNAEPGTMWGYIQGLASLLKVCKFNFDLHKDPMCTENVTGYRQVMKTFFWEAAIRRSNEEKPHNPLVLSDIEKRLSHSV